MLMQCNQEHMGIMREEENIYTNTALLQGIRIEKEDRFEKGQGWRASDHLENSRYQQASRTGKPRQQVFMLVGCMRRHLQGQARRKLNVGAMILSVFLMIDMFDWPIVQRLSATFHGFFPCFRSSEGSPSNMALIPATENESVVEWIATSQAATILIR